MNNVCAACIKDDAGSLRKRGNTKGDTQSHQRSNSFKRLAPVGINGTQPERGSLKKKKMNAKSADRQRANATLPGAAGLKRGQKRSL